jgi:UDP-glucose 4-epimerase
MRAMYSPRSPGQTYNIATGNTITINDLLRTLCRLQDRPFDPVWLPGRDGDIRHSRADIRRAMEELAWQPAVAFEDGLRKLLAS